jgi:DNA polymerase-1
MIFNPKLEDIQLTSMIGLDTEFNTLDTLEADCLVISISNQHEETYVIDVQQYSKEELIIFVTKLTELDKIFCHNVKVDIGVIFSNFGILLTNGWCTMLASQIIDNGYANTKNMVGRIPNLEKPHSLHGCLRRYLKIKLGELKEKKDLQMSFVGKKLGSPISDEQMEYAGKDTKYLLKLALTQLQYIILRDLDRIIRLENKLTPVIVRMEFKGCLVDQDKHKLNIKKWKIDFHQTTLLLDACVCTLAEDNIYLKGGKYTNTRITKIVQQLDMFGGPIVEVANKNINNINYGSPSQVKDIFRRAGVPLPKDDDGKTSFGEEPLNKYLTSYPNSPLKEFITHLLKYRELSKLLGTYGTKFLTVLDRNGRIRTNYGQCFTDTGRLTSSELIKKQLGANLANIPKNKDMRSIFIPDPGYSFIDSDMTGQEVVLAGDFSGEPVLIKAFQEGFDHHSFLASISFSIIFGRQVEIKNVSEKLEIDGIVYDVKKLRDVHKSCLFAKFYGGGKLRVMNILNEYLVNHIEPEERENVADEISKALNNALPVLTKYLRGKVDECKKTGYVLINKLGRRRYFDKPEEAFGDIMNAPIQGSGADSIKLALIKIDQFIAKRAKELNIDRDEYGWICMSVYDQNLVCLNDLYLDDAKEIPKIMGESITWFLTTLIGSSDLNIRKHWSK